MKNNDYTISYANNNDIDEIIRLAHKTIRRCFSEFYPETAVEWFCDYHNADKLKHELDDGALLAIIRNKNKIIATATYYKKEIKRVFVDTKNQKEGLGKLLMCELEKKAEQIGDKSIMLFATPRTWKYYKSRGYERICAAVDIMEDGSLLAYYRMGMSLSPRNWHIEKAGINDAYEICKGQIKAFTKVAKQHNHMDMSPMADTAKDVEYAIENGLVFAAKKDNKIIGTVRGEKKDNTCVISRLWVLPEYQRLGIGDALMFEVENAFDNLKTYKLFTGSKSKGSIKFYEERGYLIIKYETCRDYELVYFEKMNAAELL